jgi:hypothetical protein
MLFVSRSRGSLRSVIGTREGARHGSAGLPQISQVGLPPGVHYYHYRYLRLTHLPLSPAQRSGTWTHLPVNPQAGGENRNGVVLYAGGLAESPKGSGGVSSVPPVEPGLGAGEREDLPPASGRVGRPDAAGKKTAAAIQQEVSREVEHFLRLFFRERGHRGRVDLEAVEMALRSAMPRAGAATLMPRRSIKGSNFDQNGNRWMDLGGGVLA